MAANLLDLSQTRAALWAIERNDQRGFVTWKDLTGHKPVESLLLWTDAEKAERYNVEELRNTGVPYRIVRDAALPFLERMFQANVEFVFLNRFPSEAARTESHVHGITRTIDLIAYLRGGGRIAGQRRT